MIPDNSVTSLAETLKKLGKLYMENARYTAAEKTTILISASMIFMVVYLLAIIILVFLVLGLADALNASLSPYWVYLAVSGFFTLLVGLFFILRVKLVYNPVARFISKLFIEAPAR